MAKNKNSRYRVELERLFDSEDFRSRTIEIVHVNARSLRDAERKAQLLVRKKSEYNNDYDVVYSVKSVGKI